MKTETLLMFFIALLTGALVFLGITNKDLTEQIQELNSIEPDTISNVDTIHTISYIKERVPVKVYERVIKTDTITVPANNDTIAIPFQRTQAVYSDSNYTAYVSGVEPSLDSINIAQKYKTVTKTEIIQKNIIKKENWMKRHLGVGIYAGYGYGLNSKEFEPQVGAGFQIKF